MKFNALTEDTSMKPFVDFLRSSDRNKWIVAGQYEVYVRKGHHYVDGAVRDTFDLANISTDEHLRGKGEFRAMVLTLVKLLEKDKELRGEITCVYIESVLNDRLAASLPTMGFALQPNTVPPSFYHKLAVG